MQATGVAASAISYSILVRACAQALDAASTERWMYAMLTIGVAGDHISYRTLAEACAKALDGRRGAWMYT